MHEIPEIVKLLQSKQYEQAVRQCQVALSSNNHPQLHLFLGIALGELGNIKESKYIFDKLLTHFSKNFEINFNYALILEKNKLYVESIRQYEACLIITPNHFQSLRNVALLYFQLQNLKSSLDATEKYLSIDPQNDEMLNLNGLIFTELNQTNLAITCFENALTFKPNHLEYLINISTALALSGQITLLKKHLKKILTFEKSESFAFVASMYEKNNMLTEAEETLKLGLNFFPSNPDLLLTNARIEKQKKNFDEAINSINSIKTMPSEIFEQELIYEKANILDRKKDYDLAWSTAEKANLISLKAWKESNPLKDSYNQVCYNIFQYLNKSDQHSIKPINHQLPRDITFVFGFTRSGTTLIDSILSAHSDIEVLEELPLIRDLVNQFPKSTPANHFKQLLSITDKQKIQLRERYFAQISKYVSLPESNIIIDKSPLNTTLVAFIKTVFPESKIIFSIRHPLDVCVSCFFQQFEFNSYMTNMTSIESIAKTYDAILSVWNESIKKFNIDVHFQVYEELISDFGNQSKNLVLSQGVEWQEQILNYQLNLQNRAVIPNPSYNQVNQPIYQTAKNRYKNYISKLGPAIEILTPWIQHFNYKI